MNLINRAGPEGHLVKAGQSKQLILALSYGNFEGGVKLNPQSRGHQGEEPADSGVVD